MRPCPLKSLDQTKSFQGEDKQNIERLRPSSGPVSLESLP